MTFAVNYLMIVILYNTLNAVTAVSNEIVFITWTCSSLVCHRYLLCIFMYILCKWINLFFPFLPGFILTTDRQTDRRQDGYAGGGCARRLGGRLVEDVVRSRREGEQAAQGDGKWWRRRRERGGRWGRGRLRGHPFPRAQCRHPGQPE